MSECSLRCALVEAGSSIGQGAHSELLASEGANFRLYDAQFAEPTVHNV